MKSALLLAISQFENLNSDEYYKTYLLLNQNKALYEKVKKQFFNTCSICYKINSIESYCNCKITIHESTDINTRDELLKFIDLYQKFEEIDKNCTLTPQEKYVVSLGSAFELDPESFIDKPEPFENPESYIDINDSILTDEQLKYFEPIFCSPSLSTNNQTHLTEKKEIEVAIKDDIDYLSDVVGPTLMYLSLASFFYSIPVLLLLGYKFDDISFLGVFIPAYFLIYKRWHDNGQKKFKVSFFNQLLISEKSWRIHLYIALGLFVIHLYKMIIGLIIIILLLFTIVYILLSWSNIWRFVKYEVKEIIEKIWSKL